MSTSEEIWNKVSTIQKEINGNSFIKIVNEYYSKMIDDNITFEDYHNDYTQFINGLPDNLFKDYCTYKLGIYSLLSIQMIKSVLIIDEQISAIDYYETYIDVLQNLVQLQRYRLMIQKICKELHAAIGDSFLRNILLSCGEKVRSCDIEFSSNKAIEYDTKGEYAELIEYYKGLVPEQKSDFELSVLIAKTGYNIKNLNMYYCDFWISVQAIYSAYDNYQSIECIGKYLKRFFNTSWKYKIMSFMSRKLNAQAPFHVYALSLLNEYYLSPLFYICIPDLDSKLEYLKLYESTAPATSALHIFTLTGRIEEEKKEFNLSSKV